jgi:hypothetical protein
MVYVGKGYGHRESGKAELHSFLSSKNLSSYTRNIHGAIFFVVVEETKSTCQRQREHP